MAELSKVEQDLVKAINSVISEEFDCEATWLVEGGNSYLNAKILALIKEALQKNLP